VFPVRPSGRLPCRSFPLPASLPVSIQLMDCSHALTGSRFTTNPPALYRSVDSCIFKVPLADLSQHLCFYLNYVSRGLPIIVFSYWRCRGNRRCWTWILIDPLLPLLVLGFFISFPITLSCGSFYLPLRQDSWPFFFPYTIRNPPTADLFLQRLHMRGQHQ